MIIPLLIAALTCTPQNDGSWVCVAENQIPGDSGVVETPGVGFTCTNCVNMTPSDCSELRSDIMSISHEAQRFVVQALDELHQSITNMEELVSLYDSFLSCPYSRLTTSPPTTNQLAQVVDAWNDSPNRTVLGLPLAQLRFGPYAQREWEYVVGLWEASFEASQKAIQSFNQSLSSLSDTESKLYAASDTIDIVWNGARSITCDPCVLSTNSVSGGGGGGGVDQGCAECYLAILREIREAVTSFRADFRLYAQSVTNTISRYFAEYNSASDLLNRDSIHIDLQYYDEQVFGKTGEDAKFNQEKFEELNYFSRVELLLAHLAGVQTNSVESLEGERANVVTNSFLNVTNDVFAAIYAVSNTTASFVALSSHLVSVIDEMGDAFGVSSPSTDGIELLPAGKWLGDMALVLRVPVQWQEFSHTVFTCIVYVAAVVAAWLLVSSIFSTVVSVLRWAFSLLSP